MLQHFKADAPESLTLNTANGEITVTEVVSLQCVPLGEEVAPFILDDTPSVLSVGRRCLDGGYSFHWPSFRTPYFVTPKGKVVKLQVEGYVPYLIEAEGYVPAVPIVAKANIRPVPSSRPFPLYDSWKTRPDGVVVRYHVNPRTSLFTPVTIQDCPVDARKLQFDRTTFLLSLIHISEPTRPY